MSYLNTPRLHFSGRFRADPSTINNNDSNWDPNTQLSNDPNADGWVYWNPTGTHNWMLVDCMVRGAANSQGPFSAPGTDPVIGAQVLSSGEYPAKLVDLDPDNQQVSQIWGLQIQIRIPDPADATTDLASVTATMPATAFGDLWNRTTNAPGPGMSTMGASFQAVLQNVKWVNAAASPLLAELQKISPSQLSIRFNVDSYQPNSNQPNFTLGRVAGTIGPALAGESPRSTPRRLAPVYSSPANNGPYLSILSTYGPAGAAWDEKRSVLILDLGNCVPTVWSRPASGPSVPEVGWPTITATFQLSSGGSVIGTVSPLGAKSGAGPHAIGGTPVPGAIHFDTHLYLTYAGVVEVAVAKDQVAMIANSPLALTNVSVGQTAVREDSTGRYVDMDVPFLRLNPGESATITLWATRYGQPWAGIALPVALQPPVPAANGGPWNNNDPPSALALSTSTVTTASNGAGTLTLTASNPGTPRMYPDGKPGPDGQIYAVTSLTPIADQPPALWPSLGQIFLFPGAPINVLVFSSYPMPAKPNWDEHVEPIMGTYARMYPYMKGIIDLGDYETVKQNADGIQWVLNLDQADPHFMPVVRDLSADKLAMLNQWFADGMPKSGT